MIIERYPGLQPVKAFIDTSVDMKTPPIDLVNKMPAAAYPTILG
jgi:hypothetical protein